MTTINHSRRKWLSLGGVVLGATMLPSAVMADVPTLRSRILRLRNINTGETLSTEIANIRGNGSVMQKFNWFMRDWHLNRARPMDPNLFIKLAQLQYNLAFRNVEIQILSGYRTVMTNNALRQRSRGVASNSYHIRGQAADIRIPGVSLSAVRTIAMRLNNGGVGYYPRSNFVHVDTGPVRSWGS